MLVCPSISLFVRPSICLSVCMYGFLYLCQYLFSVHPPVCHCLSPCFFLSVSYSRPSVSLIRVMFTVCLLVFVPCLLFSTQVSKKLADLVLENHSAYVQELQRVTDIESSLQTTTAICSAGRRYTTHYISSQKSRYVWCSMYACLLFDFWLIDFSL